MPLSPHHGDIADALRVLSARLRSARLQAGLTQREVAKAIGLGDATPISAIERGRRVPEVVTLTKFAALYSRQTDHFLEPLWHVYKTALLRDRRDPASAPSSPSNQAQP